MKMDTMKAHWGLVLLIFLSFGPLWGQARFQSKASGTWNSASTWLLLGGSSASGIPGSADTVDILSGHVITTGASTADCATLTVEAGGSLSINGAGNVQVNATSGAATILGTLIQSSSGTLLKVGSGTRSLFVGSTGKITLSGSAASPAFDSYSYDPASTCEFTALANQNIPSGVAYGNLTLGGSGTKTVWPVPPDTAFRCNGTLSVAAGVYFDVSTHILRIYFNGDVVNYGTIDASVGITVLWMNGANWLDYGTYLPSVTPGFGYNPATIFTNTAMGGNPTSQTFYDLIVQGSVSALSNFTVTRHVTISAGGTFNAGTGLTHTVGGNWTNNGTFNAGTSTIAFTGNSGQTIGSSTFYNVDLSDSLGATLAGDVTIAPGGSFTLSKGNLATGAYTLAINSADPGSLALGANKITGTVTRAIEAGSSGTYLFFGANGYVIPGGSGNPTSITATVYPSANPPNLPPGVDTGAVLKRYFTISGSGAGPAFSYTLRLPYERPEVRGNQAIYSIWENTGGGWMNVGTSGPLDTVNHFAQQVALTGFGEWTLAENTAPLPIQLGSFDAAVLANPTGVQLSWTTVSEINNYGFYVQRSTSSNTGFVDLPGNFVAGSGTSLASKHYQWVDRNPTGGADFYRLKQVDLDGSYRFTQAVKVSPGAISQADARQPIVFSLAQNYPNPFNPSTRINFSVDNAGFTTLKVYNILGEEVATLFAGAAVPGTDYSVSFDGSSLANGAYFYRLTNADKTSLKKMVLLK